ncbi:pilus assembly protein [Erythrobacter insulae]|uniref:Pilus assembly protein n=1 Tax=Erythrobacter insulae TaxID=2584124 RepID=A0A547PEL6_9SPHN|nr:TadE family protein [Erythrobacter insulae]TRD12585.1 pilus assembly protein [Erythrobacter insulae]
MIKTIRKIRRPSLRAIAKDTKGGAVVEFALLAPMFFVMLLGVLQVGVYLQNYNAVQSLASDGARYVMVEYQKENTLSDEQIRTVLLGEAVNAPYLLDSDRLRITVDRSGTSRVNGAIEIDLTLSYVTSDFLPIDMPGATITYSRPVWVVT